MSLVSRAAQRLRYLYGCVLQRERIRTTDAHQVWLALHAGPEHPTVEQLEPRLLLSGSLPGPVPLSDLPLNRDAADTSNVDDIQLGTSVNNPATGSPYTLTGAGMVLGVWDAGDVLTTHQEFYISDGDPTSRVLDMKFNSQYVVTDHNHHQDYEQKKAHLLGQLPLS